VPLFPSSDIGINVGVYFNFGNVWGSKFDENKEMNKYGRLLHDDITHIRTSVGCFVSLRFPNFPIRFDWARALTEQAHDRKETFSIGVDV